jgi:hypothetical protein
LIAPSVLEGRFDVKVFPRKATAFQSPPTTFLTSPGMRKKFWKFSGELGKIPWDLS